MARARKKKDLFRFPMPALPHYLEHLVDTPRNELPEQLGYVMHLFDYAAGKTPASDRSAYSIGKMFEFGIPPLHFDSDDADAWYKYAASIGSVFAAFRVFQGYKKGYAGETRMAWLSYVIHLLCMEKTNSQMLSSREVASFCLTVAKEAINCQLLPDRKLKAILHVLKKMDEYQVKDVVEQVEARLSPAKPFGNHLVLKSKIHRDAEFKPGIYTVLEEPLSLVQSPEDLNAIEDQLNAEFPWFSDANQAVARQLRIKAMSADTSISMRPLLLVGVPGLGKTTWARRLAELLNMPVRVVMAAGSFDSMFLRGTPKGWSSARPGAVLETMAVEKIANPLFVIDEIDKASTSNSNGRIWDVLLQLLEPASSKAYLDECLSQPCDLSKVTWIATANSLGVLPTPLLERFTVVLVRPPSQDELMSIADTVRKRMAAELGMDERMLPQQNGDEVEILKQCKNPRQLSRVAREMIENGLLAKRKMRMH